MAKRFSDLGIVLPDERKIFNCQQVSITDVVNIEIEVVDYIPDVKTKHGDGRFLIHFRNTSTNEYGKFFTSSNMLKSALVQISKSDFPFNTVIKSVKCGNSKMYQFT